MGRIEKPKLLKVFGRSHYACTRCKYSKIKCSGQKPCSNCKNVNMADACVYPAKDRKVVVMESDLDRLHDRVESLEQELQGGPSRIAKVEEIEDLEEADEYKREQARIRKLYFERGEPPVGQDVNEYIESFLRSDIRKNVARCSIYEICKAMLPSKEYTVRMIETVQEAYSSEFYLIDMDYIKVLVEKTYTFFEGYTVPDDRDLTMQNAELCHLFIIIAFGEQITSSSQCLEDDSTFKNTPGLAYYILSVEIFDICTDKITLQYIQSATLLALFSANISRYNIVYIFLGVAMRCCLSKGYHRNVNLCAYYSDSVELSLIYREKQKRLFWSVLVIETTWSANRMSLPVQMNYIDTDVDLPCENTYDLNDLFDSEILEVNVHLAKYVAKFLSLIYGPNIRTLSINYINTVQFNRKGLVKNILECLDDIVKNFEQPYLIQFNHTNIIQRDGRRPANLFLRYHQLIIFLTKPLLCMVLKRFLDWESDDDELDYVISKGIDASLSTIDIISTLQENEKLFILGYWDSQHLFSAITMILLSSFAGNKFDQIKRGIGLLKFMRERNNINAAECLSKLQNVFEMLSNFPNLQSSLGLNENYAFLNVGSYSVENFPHFNKDCIIDIDRLSFQFKSKNILHFDSQTHSELCSLIDFIQGWDDNRNFTNKFT